MSETWQEVLDEVAPLAEVFSSAGRSLYLVGGIVRDLVMNEPLESLDFDFTTDARPVEIKRLVSPLSEAVWAQGEKFGTIGCQIAGRPYEITTHRAETYVESSRKPQVQFGDCLEIDLSRRDFTINAMAIRVSDGELVDPFNGRQALDQLILRTPIAPEVSFSDDPLRIVRAARFIARFGLSVDERVLSAAKSLSDRLSIVSVERIRDELDKLLRIPAPARGLKFGVEVGAWLFVAPWIDDDRVSELGEQLDRSRPDDELRRAIIFSHCAPEDRVTQLSNLRYSNAQCRTTRLVLTGLDLVAHGGPILEPAMVRRLVDRVGYGLVGLLLELIDVLEFGDRGLRSVFTDLDGKEDLTNLKPVLSGEDIMELLQIEAGPRVGAALEVLQERRFEDGPLDREGESGYLLGRYSRG